MRYEKIIEFKDIHGLTFVFTTTFIFIEDEIVSAEITPTGIIYKNKTDICFAPLTKTKDLKEIIKKYVDENRSSLEEEYFHSQQ